MPEMRSRVLLVSPHLDDAVFGCGALLAASDETIVCNVFTGSPEEDLTTDWDLHCGFSSAHEAMRSRIDEDERALGLLSARSVNLGFLDSQYVPHAPESAKPTRAAIRDALLHVVREYRPDLLLIPLGLFHSDHALTHFAACDAWLEYPALACIGYEEGLYRRMRGLVQRRLVDLHGIGIDATPYEAATTNPADAERAHAAKRNAVQAYTSQLKAFGPGGYDDVFLSERYWTLERCEDGR
ncbi:PIG-L family deacetylase [Caballeronia sp. GAWG2-1]|uniref:PIG-L deacetylase family protein n=1 Tax=Caballeronia sp. GAWG2-1 TaxID=2921744 RepID=UPI002027CD6F|nr:PIG-L family deacetylase [Caballeronia sp. GAWG2-1]